MNKQIRLLFALTMIAMLLAAGCRPAAEPTTAPEPTTAAVEPTKAPAEPTKAPEPTDTPVPAGPKVGGRVVVAHRQEPDRFWPPFSGLTVAHEVGGAMNHPLIGINEKNEYYPILLTEVPTVENGDLSEDCERPGSEQGPLPRHDPRYGVKKVRVMAQPTSSGSRRVNAEAGDLPHDGSLVPGQIED